MLDKTRPENTQMRIFSVATTLLFATLLGGCSLIPFLGSDDDDDVDIEAIETTEQKLYSQAQRSLRSSNFSLAIEQLELMEARFPFGRFAEQSQLELIYAHYMTSDTEAARAGADRFIRLHPSHDSVDYAFYLRALAAYKNDPGLIDRLVSATPAKRDMGPLNESYTNFGILLSRFPDSQYAPDALQRMLQLRNILAESEIEIANYYLTRGAYIAAANRANYVLENYPDSPARADALATLVETNWNLDLKEEANRALRVLAINHPEYKDFDSAGNLVLETRIRNRDRSWANIMTLGLFDRPDVPPPITVNSPKDFNEPVSGAESTSVENLPTAEKKS
ncbi:MAG: outer membrane protein assembly factor BamD [Candidatus Azotimanducaceae bacterium]